jgi:hypothetical protein
VKNFKYNHTNSGYQKFICDYSFEDNLWSVHIYAKSFDEANQRLRRIASGKIIGISKAEIPYQLGWLAKGWVWFKHLTFTGTKPPPTP